MCFCHTGQRRGGLSRRKRSRIWNQPHPRKTSGIDQWTYYKQDEVVFGVMGFALLVKVDDPFPTKLIRTVRGVGYGLGETTDA